jgi:hypothetical protein
VLVIGGGGGRFIAYACGADTLLLIKYCSNIQYIGGICFHLFLRPYGDLIGSFLKNYFAEL